MKNYSDCYEINMKSLKATLFSGKSATFPEDAEELGTNTRGATAPEITDSISDKAVEDVCGQFCDLCVEDDQQAAANVFCKECEQRLCDRCHKTHKRVKFTREHKILTLGIKTDGAKPIIQQNEQQRHSKNVHESKVTEVNESLDNPGKSCVKESGDKRLSREKTALHTGQLNVTEISDEDTAIVCAMEFLDGGLILVCDSANNKIKLFDTNSKVISSARLTSKPSGLVMIDNMYVMASLPIEKCLQVAHIENGNEIKLVSKADTSKRYLRLMKYQNNMIVHAEDDTHRFIFVMDQKGKEVECYIVTDTKGTGGKLNVIRYMCKSPQYKALYLTDRKRGCVSISLDGEFVATYKEENTKEYWGVCCDNDGDVYVSCPTQDKITLLNNRAEKIKDLIVLKGMDPGYIAYNRATNKLYVWSDQKRHVLVYTVESKIQ